MRNKNHNNNSSYVHYYEWIDKKILANPFSDYRKIIINLILAPYLIVIKKLSFVECYQIINEWLQKCDLLSGRKLDFKTRSFIDTALTTAYKKQIPPMSIITLKTNYKDLYFLIVQKERERKK
ncbi:MAG TPA: DNA primase noncatalytic subunit PriX [Nitrososphaeraceae archaeon]|nr:DNA primase noncatalytic subunit PriX [Nitrososphaeraceae archaeon]